MTEFKKYKHKESGEVVEAVLTKLYLVDNCHALTHKGNEIVLGDLGAVMKIKGDYPDVYWKCYTFNEQYKPIN